MIFADTTLAEVRSFELEADDASIALREFARQARVSIVIDREEVQGVETNPVSGLLEPRAALERLLKGTSLVFDEDSETGAFAVTNPSLLADNMLQQNPNNRANPMNDKLSQSDPGKSRNIMTRLAGVIVTSLIATAQPSLAQVADTDEDEIFELSPFTVESDETIGYYASSTLAGTRLRTSLEDVGASVQVLTQEFIDDLGATDAQSILSYATNMETNGVRGDLLVPGSNNFSSNTEENRLISPSGATRVRGLVSADMTNNYFRTAVGWDTYNVERVDLLRGPNSILFGLGSPGGVMNTTTISAQLGKDMGEVQLATDEHGTLRGSLDYNKELIDDQLAIRIALLEEKQKFAQDPAYEDQSRQFLTATYRPEFLNRNGTFFTIKANFENGNINANRPRFSPPTDRFTPMVNGYHIGEIRLPEGSNLNGYTSGVIPAISNTDVIGFVAGPDILLGFGGNPSGIGVNFDGNGMRYNVSADDSFEPFWVLGRGGAYGARTNNSGGIATNPFGAFVLGSLHKERVFDGIPAFATSEGHPFAAQFSFESLDDPSIFDFYSRLVDGPNKREWEDWDSTNLTINNTFFNNLFGYEISIYEESSERGQTTLIGGVNRMQVDLNQFLLEGMYNYYMDLDGTDGTEADIAAALAANRNPNYGRIYIQETTYGGNRIFTNDLESKRFSTYLDFDFRERTEMTGWLASLLGRHVLQGVYSEDYSENFSRNYQRHVYPEDLLTYVGRPGQRFNNNTRVAIRYYLSEDISGMSSLSGLNIPGLDKPILESFNEPIQGRVFDTTWIAGDSVMPQDPWGTVPTTTQDTIQGRNPANYTGWITGSFPLIDALSGNPDDLDLATRSASISSSDIESKIFSWQGYFWNDAIVATIGYREDEAIARNDNTDVRPDGGAVLDSSFGLDAGDRYELSVTSRNQSVVAHLNRLPLLDFLPLLTSLTYNKGENFQPAAGRLSRLGNSLAPPKGETEEYGILLRTKDGKYAFKATKYETSVVNSSVGGTIRLFILDQFLGPNGAGGAYAASSGELRDLYNAEEETPTWSIDDQENIHAPAWYAFESDFKATFPNYVAQWLNTGLPFAPSDDTTQFHIGGTNTADTISRGYEFELVANPIRGLRLAINASKTEAVVSNAPGDDARALLEYFNDALWNDQGTEALADDTLTAVGAMRTAYDPFGDVNGTIGEWFRNQVWADYLDELALNGQLSRELAEWRFNLIANYTFTEGRLKGWGFGTSYRWEDERAIGYNYMFNEVGNVVPNVSAPMYSPTNDRIDFNINYRTSLNERVDWKIQLNIFNAFGDDELRPVTANPDGSFSGYRIQEGRSWRITSTITF